MAMSDREFERRKAAVKRQHGLSEAQYDANPGEAFPGEREYLLASANASSVPWGFIIFGGACVLAAMAML